MFQYSKIITTLEELASIPLDVLIIGTGPAGVAVAERLYSQSPIVRIGMLERGNVLTTTHVSNIFRDDPVGQTSGPYTTLIEKRRAFIEAHADTLWTGDYEPIDGDAESGGRMILALGGRGLVAGAHLRRFDPVDMTLWPDGLWPIEAGELSRYEAYAEQYRRIASGDCDGSAQVWTFGQLVRFNPSVPPWGIEQSGLRSLQTSGGYDSSVNRLWAHLLQDYNQYAVNKERRRLSVAVHAYATKINTNKSHSVTDIECIDIDTSKVWKLHAKTYVLAASPIESTRLCLNSGLGGPQAGHYLAEHLYSRAYINVDCTPGAVPGQGVRVMIPPPGVLSEQRFQIEVQGEVTSSLKLQLRITGEAAMDPDYRNAVVIDNKKDEYGVPKAKVVLGQAGSWPGTLNKPRVNLMHKTIIDIAQDLGAKVSRSDITLMQPGRSHHEAGTLRMGLDPSTPTDPLLRLRGAKNVFVADASVFPSVGVANPMLTVTALGYRIADSILAHTL